jgi:hypothetical protein
LTSEQSTTLPLPEAPMWLVGAINAALFKKTRRLAPVVELHLVYTPLSLYRGVENRLFVLDFDTSPA